MKKIQLLFLVADFLYICQDYYLINKEGGIEDTRHGQKYISIGKYDTIQNSFKMKY